MEQSGNGYLKVRVTLVEGAYPAIGAKVVIRGHGTRDGGLVRYTGIGGVTEAVMLPTVRESESLVPGAVRPYSVYDVSVEHDGCCPVNAYALPIFDGVTSLKTFDLLPEDEGEER